MATVLIVVAAVVGLSPSRVLAQVAPGLQAGVSGDPDQFFVGAHVESAPLVDRLRFRPGVDFGFGDHRTLIAGNLDLVYRVPFPRTAWSLQFGGGPAVIIKRRRGDTDVEPGFNILLGVRHARGFFTEVRVGFIDSPEVKWAFGYTFR